MKTLSKIYRFLHRRIKQNLQRDKQTPTKEQKPATTPAKPPAKRVIITYGAFSLLFIILASAAWFFKRAEFLPEHLLQQTNTPSEVADSNTNPDDNKTTAAESRQNDKPTTDNLTDPVAIDELNNKATQLRDEIRQLNTELDAIRVQQYLASARYLIDTRTSPERALSILQSARTYIETRPDLPNADANIRDIDSLMMQLQRYITHSPYKALARLEPLINRIHNELETTINPQSEGNINDNETDKSWLGEWSTKIYDVSKALIRIEPQNIQYIENNRLLLKLLISARSAVLLNEQKQFNIALQDAIRLLDTMQQPPISPQQIESILSLKIIWQLPETQR